MPEINDAMARLDRAWALEYQRTEDEYRYRVVEASYDATYAAVRHAFLDLGMPIEARSHERGVIVAENAGPTPLTREEWQEVARAEEPRAREVGGWFITLAHPERYVIQVRAVLRPIGPYTLVALDYRIDSPHLRALGARPARHAPPKAVQLGTLKFWQHLEHRLAEQRLPPPRRRTGKELEA